MCYRIATCMLAPLCVCVWSACPCAGVIVLAATNRPDVLDQALLRPGRFDRQVTVDRPDVQGRVAILKVHGRGKALGKDVDLEKIARRCGAVGTWGLLWQSG